MPATLLGPSLILYGSRCTSTINGHHVSRALCRRNDGRPTSAFEVSQPSLFYGRIHVPQKDLCSYRPPFLPLKKFGYRLISYSFWRQVTMKTSTPPDLARW